MKNKWYLFIVFAILMIFATDIAYLLPIQQNIMGNMGLAREWYQISRSICIIIVIIMGYNKLSKEGK
ncbi:MAG: hypothetical protein ACTH0S_12615 [Senegalia sp. (in: firmicutes)]